MTALKVLTLVDADGHPSNELEDLVHAEGDARRALLRRILERFYTPVFDLDLARASKGQFHEAFRSFGTKEGVSRGFHAHLNLKQVAVCETGSCRFVLDNGKQREEVVLDKSTIGLLINDLTWREMHDFSPDCVLMGLVSLLSGIESFMEK